MARRCAIRPRSGERGRGRLRDGGCVRAWTPATASWQPPDPNDGRAVRDRPDRHIAVLGERAGRLAGSLRARHVRPALGRGREFLLARLGRPGLTPQCLRNGKTARKLRELMNA